MCVSVSGWGGGAVDVRVGVVIIKSQRRKLSNCMSIKLTLNFVASCFLYFSASFHAFLTFLTTLAF